MSSELFKSIDSGLHQRDASMAIKVVAAWLHLPASLLTYAIPMKSIL